MLELTAKIIISFTLLVTAFGLIIQDWNSTHVYNPEWPPHARFHAITGIVMNLLFSLMGLYLLWFIDAGIYCVLVAALTPVFCWGSFFVAVLVKGSKIEDIPNQVSRWFFIPINMLFPGIFVLLSLLGLLLYYVS